MICVAAFGSASASEDHPPAATSRPCYARLARNGTPSGRLGIALPASPREVLAMLLDFDRAAGHRAWFKSAKVLERAPGRVLVRWKMHGKLGINPSVTIEFRVSDEARATRVRYQITRPGFGLAVFSGCYDLQAIGAQAAHTRLMQTVYIASGLPFVGASPQDIADGLREDAALLRDWLEQRRAKGLAALRRSP